MMDRTDLTERELLLLMHSDLQRLNTSVQQLQTDIRNDKERNGDRFASLELFKQAANGAISAADHRALNAVQSADKANKEVGALRDEFDAFKVRVQTIAWIAGPAIAVVASIVTEYARRLIFP